MTTSRARPPAATARAAAPRPDRRDGRRALARPRVGSGPPPPPTERTGCALAGAARAGGVRVTGVAGAVRSTRGRAAGARGPGDILRLTPPSARPAPVAHPSPGSAREAERAATMPQLPAPRRRRGGGSRRRVLPHSAFPTVPGSARPPVAALPLLAAHLGSHGPTVAHLAGGARIDGRVTARAQPDLFGEASGRSVRRDSPGAAGSGRAWRSRRDIAVGESSAPELAAPGRRCAPLFLPGHRAWFDRRRGRWCSRAPFARRATPVRRRRRPQEGEPC
jgi:hypothetical protein